MNIKIIAVLALVCLVAAGAGCVFSTPSDYHPSATLAPATATVNTTATATHRATPTAATPTFTPSERPVTTPTPVTQTRVATSIYAWVPPVYYGEGLLPNPGGITPQTSVQQGSPAMVAAIVDAADGTHPCGPAFNYYIDHQAAGGYWNIPNPAYGCGVGVMQHAELRLSANDTAKLSLGSHTLQISYSGDATYAPAEYTTTFNVR